MHGWPTSIYSGGFVEELSYTDGLENHYYNGNISTMKWKFKSSNDFSGYNFEYDDCNRLTDSVFGYGDGLNGYRNYFNESACYDSNGNIIQLQRRGLVDNMHGGFGIVDNLSMTYNGNQLVSVRDNAPQLSYAGGTDFNGVRYQEYPLTYNEAGSLTSDAGRNIANIDYDLLNNPIRIQFTNGNVTKYIYSATGEKLRVVYQTAVPNISVAIGSTRELTPSEVLYTDSIDYLLGGALTLRNGRIDKYQFDEGYCQAEAYSSTMDTFNFYYFDRDHLGNIRQVIKADRIIDHVVQIVDYYPFGAEFCDGPTVSGVQSRKYNGKEFDNMHGLNTYDYGARQYNPVTARWDRIDPLAENNCRITPYLYCNGNPVNRIDPNGMIDYKVNVNGQMYEATSPWERFKSFLGYGCNQDRIFMEDGGKLIVSLPENSIQNLGKQEFVLNGKKIIQTSFTITGNSNANKAYEALTDNTNVEWVAVEDTNNKMAATILTDHKSTSANSGIIVLRDYERETSSTTFRHNHFLTKEDYHGSEFERQARLRPSSEDMSAARAHPKTTFYLDDKTNKQTLRYDGYEYWKVKKPN